MAVRAARSRLRVAVLRDVLVAAALLTVELVGVRVLDEPAPSAAHVALLVATWAAMPVRSLSPVAALVLTTAGGVAVSLLRGDQTLATVAAMLALYSVALRGGRRATVLAWAAAALPLTLAGLLGAPGRGPSPESLEALPLLPWTALVAAVGDAVRNRRAYLAAVEERAERAERTREEEALRRVAEERVRIARELHDVVAHHVAVVSVQAGVAEHLVATRPDAAAEAMGEVRRSAAAILEELGDVLSVLRRPGEAEATAPAPGLDRVDALVESFTRAGLAVDVALRGRPRPLPPTVDLVAYRVVEEALTNALKHGTGEARVLVEYGPSSLVLHVANPRRVPVAAGHAPPGPGDEGAVAGTGHGIVGMRERAAAVGGTLRAGPGPGATFVVQAELPVRGGADRGAVT